MRLLSALIMLHLTLGDSTTQTEVDFTESLNQANLPLLQSVEKTIDVQHLFNLVGGHRWTQAPDMNVTIDLPYAQRVDFLYNIAISSTVSCWFATNLWIDGVQHRQFRSHEGGFNSHEVFRSGAVFLQKGQHRAVVNYRCDCGGFTYDGSYDWTVAIFKVHYHKLKQSN